MRHLHLRRLFLFPSISHLSDTDVRLLHLCTLSDAETAPTSVIGSSKAALPINKERFTGYPSSCWASSFSPHATFKRYSSRPIELQNGKILHALSIFNKSEVVDRRREAPRFKTAITIRTVANFMASREVRDVVYYWGMQEF
jgi:hypothetical protein